MRFNFKTRIFLAYALVLLLGFALAALVVLRGGAARDAALSLIERDVPQLRAIDSLRRDLREQEAVLYAYYATRDRSQLLSRYSDLDRQCNQHLALLEQHQAKNPELRKTRAAYDSLYHAALQLDGFLAGPTPNESEAMKLLGQMDVQISDINESLSRLSHSVEDGLRTDLKRADAATRELQLNVLLLAFAIFLLSLVVGFYINRYIDGLNEKRMLAMFPERNPNAVLRLSRRGKVLYANPATQVFLERIGAADGDPLALLPHGLLRRLSKLRSSYEQQETWSYTVGNAHTFECAIHWLADLDVFHVYIEDITARKRAEEQAIHQAYHDALTDLPNRRMFQEHIQSVLYGQDRAAVRSAIFLIGVDRFKVVVDSLGHAVGDALLRNLAVRLGDALVAHEEQGANSVLFHFGGDLFCVLIPAASTEEVPVLLAEQLVSAIHQPFYVEGRELNITASIGISIYPLDGQDGATLLRNADTAMHRAKKRGGDDLQCYTRDMNERAAEWLELENELRHAEELDEFRLFYHPQVDIASGKVVGMEALLRWQHPRRGLLAPGKFLHLAEETGLIADIGDWILRAACEQTRLWQKNGLDDLVVAVNLSGRQFAEEGLSGKLEAILQETGLPSHNLEVEITETVAMQDVARATALLHELKEIGVQLSVHDFGTGFSSLNYLKRFPIDKLKIDQSFVRHIPEDREDAAIVRSVISLGHSLNLKVIAEGVESAPQLDWLRGAGCDEYQGYLAAKPLPAEEFERFARTNLGRA